MTLDGLLCTIYCNGLTHMQREIIVALIVATLFGLFPLALLIYFRDEDNLREVVDDDRENNVANYDDQGVGIPSDRSESLAPDESNHDEKSEIRSVEQRQEANQKQETREDESAGDNSKSDSELASRTTAILGEAGKHEGLVVEPDKLADGANDVKPDTSLGGEESRSRSGLGDELPSLGGTEEKSDTSLSHTSKCAQPHDPKDGEGGGEEICDRRHCESESGGWDILSDKTSAVVTDDSDGVKVFVPYRGGPQDLLAGQNLLSGISKVGESDESLGWQPPDDHIEPNKQDALLDTLNSGNPDIHDCSGSCEPGDEQQNEVDGQMLVSSHTLMSYLPDELYKGKPGEIEMRGGRKNVTFQQVSLQEVTSISVQSGASQYQAECDAQCDISVRLDKLYDGSSCDSSYGISGKGMPFKQPDKLPLSGTHHHIPIQQQSLNSQFANPQQSVSRREMPHLHYVTSSSDGTLSINESFMESGHSSLASDTITAADRIPATSRLSRRNTFHQSMSSSRKSEDSSSFTKTSQNFTLLSPRLGLKGSISRAAEAARNESPRKSSDKSSSVVENSQRFDIGLSGSRFKDETDRTETSDKDSTSSVQDYKVLKNVLPFQLRFTNPSNRRETPRKGDSPKPDLNTSTMSTDSYASIQTGSSFLSRTSATISSFFSDKTRSSSENGKAALKGISDKPQPSDRSVPLSFFGLLSTRRMTDEKEDTSLGAGSNLDGQANKPIKAPVEKENAQSTQSGPTNGKKDAIFKAHWSRKEEMTSGQRPSVESKVSLKTGTSSGAQANWKDRLAIARALIAAGYRTKDYTTGEQNVKKESKFHGINASNYFVTGGKSIQKDNRFQRPYTAGETQALKNVPLVGPQTTSKASVGGAKDPKVNAIARNRPHIGEQLKTPTAWASARDTKKEAPRVAGASAGERTPFGQSGAKRPNAWTNAALGSKKAALLGASTSAGARSSLGDPGNKKGPVIGSQINKKGPVIGSTVHKKDPFAGPHVYKRGPVDGSTVNKKDPFAGSYVYKRGPVDGSRVIKKDPFAGSHVYKRGPVDGSTVNKKDPFAGSHVNKRGPSVWSQVNKKDAFVGSQVNKRGPVIGSQVNKKDPFVALQVNKKNSFSGSQANKREQINGPKEATFVSQVNKKDSLTGSHVNKRDPVIRSQVSRKDPSISSRAPSKDPFIGSQVDYKGPFTGDIVKHMNPFKGNQVNSQDTFTGTQVNSKNPFRTVHANNDPFTRDQVNNDPSNEAGAKDIDRFSRDDKAIDPFTGADVKAIDPFTGDDDKAIDPFTGDDDKAIDTFTGDDDKAINPFTGDDDKAIDPFTVADVKAIDTFNGAGVSNTESSADTQAVGKGQLVEAQVNNKDDFMEGEANSKNLFDELDSKDLFANVEANVKDKFSGILTNSKEQLLGVQTNSKNKLCRVQTNNKNEFLRVQANSKDLISGAPILGKQDIGQKDTPVMARKSIEDSSSHSRVGQDIRYSLFEDNGGGGIVTGSHHNSFESESASVGERTSKVDPTHFGGLGGNETSVEAHSLNHEKDDLPIFGTVVTGKGFDFDATRSEASCKSLTEEQAMEGSGAFESKSLIDDVSKTTGKLWRSGCGVNTSMYVDVNGDTPIQPKVGSRTENKTVSRVDEVLGRIDGLFFAENEPTQQVRECEVDEEIALATLASWVPSCLDDTLDFVEMLSPIQTSNVQRNLQGGSELLGAEYTTISTAKGTTPARGDASEVQYTPTRRRGGDHLTSAASVKEEQEDGREEKDDEDDTIRDTRRSNRLPNSSSWKTLSSLSGDLSTSTLTTTSMLHSDSDVTVVGPAPQLPVDITMSRGVRTQDVPVPLQPAELPTDFGVRGPDTPV